jgi:hypothetical protein
MTSDEFASLFRKGKDDLLALYTTTETTSVAIRIASLNLNDKQKEEMKHILDEALTDSFYMVLMALGGACRIGEIQQAYTILDEEGSIVCKSDDGALEASAWTAFQSDRK